MIYNLIEKVNRKKEISLNVDLYCCYSLALRNYLRDSGVSYKLCALNPNSKQRFWVYVKDEKLNDLLDRWSANK